MREIKFRAWCKNTKKWLEPDQSDRDWPMLLAIGLHGLPICIDKDSVKGGEIIGWNRDHNIELSQFTGLIDKDGVDIYEGDIVAFGDDMLPERVGLYGEIGSVFYCEDTASFCVNLAESGRYVTLADHKMFSNGETCRQVIGNIHQNPELLCAKK